MKKTTQVEILHWAKTRHNVNTKYIHKHLKSKDFDALCLLLQKNKVIGGVVDPKKMVKEYLDEHGTQFIPSSAVGTEVDVSFYFNTHPLKENGCIEVDLYHILLQSWCKPTRSNYRLLKRHLKELGYEIKTFTPTYSTHTDNSFVVLKEGYPLTLPKALVKHKAPLSWCKAINLWVYQSMPHITLKNEPYCLTNLGSRWEAYFTQRFIELFEMSETTYLHKHPKVRGCYENAPPVIALCELTLRDVFKPTSLKDWIDTVLRTSHLDTYGKDSEVDQVFLDTIYDEICGKLSKTMVKGKPLERFKVIGGWISIIVIAYVNDTLKEYESLL
jgi:hypothetical protein